MAEISRAKLFGKLNSLAYKAIESATVFAKMRGNPYVEMVHWLVQIVQLQDSDLIRIVRHFKIDPSRLAADMQAALDRLPRGSTSGTDLSAQLESAVERAWTYATLLYGESRIRTGHLVVGILKTPEMKNVLRNVSPELEKIKGEQLGDDFNKICGGSVEETLAAKDGSAVGGGAAPGEASGATAPPAMGKQEALNRFSTDYTERARKGELDPVIGRDDEIRQIIDILMRRRQNNPILTGEAGVGKTAVVEGFAQRIVKGDVPPALKNIAVKGLDLTLLQAGASMKGEFEQRLRSVIEEVQQSPTPIVLFIDEAHNLVGAGGQAGQGDAANLLKPALARGTLRTIAATTFAEYKQYFEKDPALTRRFQVIQIDEPTEQKAALMLRGLASTMEKHHQVQLLDEAIEAACRLSHRYIQGRQLPDKAVSLLDTACARVAVGQHATPAELEDCVRRIEVLKTEAGILERESAIGVDHAARKVEVAEKLAAEDQRRVSLEARHKEEKGLVTKILDIRATLRQGGAAPDSAQSARRADARATPASSSAASATSPGSGGAAGGATGGATAVAEAPAGGNGTGGTPAGLSPQDRERILGELKTLQAQLSGLQGESPLILPSVDAQAIASVVADWTGIPVGRMVKNEIEAVLKLADTLEKRVIGQRHALEQIGRRIQTSRANLDNPNRPVGVFMLAGPSGVGKTETALALAEALYGGEQNMITLNMSEFQDEQSASSLKGAAPGLVGYGRGGILTEAVRRRPYSVVLLDEVEKAHKDIHEMFFQVFDKGVMEDTEGNEANFKNSIIILTSNAAQDVVVNMCKDPDLMPDPEGLEKAMRAALVKVFPDALLNRLVVVPYFPISKEMLSAIIQLNLTKVQKRVRQNHKVAFSYDPSVPALIAERCTELERGARMVDAMITNTMLPDISRELLGRMMDAKPVKRIHVGREGNGFSYSFD